MVNRKGVFIGAYVPNDLKETLRRRAAAEHRTGGRTPVAPDPRGCAEVAGDTGLHLGERWLPGAGCGVDPVAEGVAVAGEPLAGLAAPAGHPMLESPAP